MKQRKFEIVINENLNRNDGVRATVSMRTGSHADGYNVVDYKYQVAELTEEQIVEAVG